MTYIELEKRSNLKTEDSPKEERISLRNYLKKRTTNSSSLSRTNSVTSNTPQTKLMNKILNETEDEKKEEKQRQTSNNINRLNKLNIFVGEYDILLLDQVVAKSKIYDGNLCTTYLVKKEVDKKITEGLEAKEKVKRLLSDGKTIFIANDSGSTKDNVFRAPFIKTSGTSRITIDRLITKDVHNERTVSSKNITRIKSNFLSSRKIKNNSKFPSGVVPKIETGLVNKTGKNDMPVFLLNSNKKIEKNLFREEKGSTKDDFVFNSNENVTNQKKRLSITNDYKIIQSENRDVKFKIYQRSDTAAGTNSNSASVINSILRKKNQIEDQIQHVSNRNSSVNFNKSPIMFKLMYQT